MATMSLRDWFAEAATATPATPATVTASKQPSVATVATVSVANTENFPEIPRTASLGQRQELRELIAIVLARDTEAERTETLAVACADPETALTSFRALVADSRDPRSQA